MYAKWTPIEYSVTYNLNGGRNSYLNPDSFTVENNEIELSAPIRPGYKFEGWYTTSSFEENTKIQVIPSQSEGDIVLYANWNKITYTITYDLSDGATILYIFR